MSSEDETTDVGALDDLDVAGGLEFGPWYLTDEFLRLFELVAGRRPTANELAQIFPLGPPERPFLRHRLDIVATAYCVPCATHPTSKGTRMQGRGQVGLHLEGERHLRKVGEYDEDREEEKRAEERGDEKEHGCTTGSCLERTHRGPGKGDGKGDGGGEMGSGLVV